MTLIESVRELHAANLAILAAQHEYSRCRAAVVEIAKADPLDRRVVVLGMTAYYIDAPGTHGNDGGGDGWSVTYGSPPEVIEGASK